MPDVYHWRVPWQALSKRHYPGAGNGTSPGDQVAEYVYYGGGGGGGGGGGDGAGDGWDVGYSPVLRPGGLRGPPVSAKVLEANKFLWRGTT